MKRKCQRCEKEVDKLYELRGWLVCWDCYWEDVDKNETQTNQSPKIQ